MAKKLKLSGNIAQRVFNTPLLIEPGKAQIILDVLMPRFSGAGAMDWYDDDEKDDKAEREEKKPYQVVDFAGQSVAVLCIVGTLVHRGGVHAMSGMMSYQKIKDSLIDLAEDETVKGIILDIDSPGGEVSGLFDLAEMVREINNNEKPVWAISNESCFSAAYALACAAGKVFMTQTAMVGSIGVIMQHVDFSKNNEMNGIKVTSIFAGDHKNDFSPDEPLSSGAKARAQKEVDDLYTIFVDHVAAMRGITSQAVRETEADIFNAADAVKIGLANNISTLDQLVYNLTQEVGATTSLSIQQNEGANAVKIFGKRKETKAAADETVETEAPATAGVDEQAAADAAAAAEKEATEKAAAEKDAPPHDEATGGDADTDNGSASPSAEAEKPGAVVEPQNVAAEIAQMAADHGMAAMAADLIRSCTTVEAATAILKNGRAAKITKICALAGHADKAAGFIADASKTFEAVQKELVTLMAVESEKAQVSGSQSPAKATEDFEAASVLVKDAERRAAEFKANQKK